MRRLELSARAVDLRVVRSYKVLLRGRGCRVRLRERRSLLRRSVREVELLPVSRRGERGRWVREDELGFYTTRWVEARSVEDAAERARVAVVAELREYVTNGVDQPITVDVEEIEECDPGSRVRPSGSDPFLGATTATNMSVPAPHGWCSVARGPCAASLLLVCSSRKQEPFNARLWLVNPAAGTRCDIAPFLIARRKYEVF